MKAALVIGVLAIGGVLMVAPLYGTIPLVPLIARDYNVPVASVAWIGFAFGFAYACACLLFGPLSDVTGRKRVIVIGIFVEGVLSIATAASPSLPVLIVARVAQGFAAGTFGPIALGYIGETYAGPLRATGISVLSTGLISAGSIGQIVAQLMATAHGWRSFFVLVGALEILTGVVLSAILREPPVDRSSRSLAGTYAAEGALLQTPAIRGTYLVGFVLYLGFVLYYVALGPHVQLLGGSASSIFAMRAVALPGMLLTIFAGLLVTRFGGRQVVAGGLIVAIAGLILTVLEQSNTDLLTAASALYSVGFAFAAVSMNVVVGELGGAVRGTALAFFVFVAFTGAAIAPLVAGWLAPFGFSATIAELAQATIVAWLFMEIAVPRERPVQAVR
jgi:MFS transporter, YNFM family, putative membrane transport protein